ncbi:MAG TPA: alcohol dehydrogenase catalytic domain-containing protein [Candidatus Dormibacteraeota bacterium]|nr:alcohol dehydrogenase catalytic domain-containing protein [Candidatus Dormibacteraeota bacterium]
MRYVEISPGEVILRQGAPLPLSPGHARVRVAACGVCGSDLHLVQGMVLPRGAAYPVRPGHEVAGTVIELSPDVEGLALGERVVLHPLDVCGDCVACRQGREERCRRGRVLGLQAAGGMADEVVWPARRLVPVGEVPFDLAAVLADAVATAHHALRLADPPPGGRLCVIGAGGVGSHVVQLARVLRPDLRVGAVVRSPTSARRLEAMGATVAVGLEGAAARLKDEVGRFDAVVDFSGTASAPAEGLAMLEAGGRLVLGSIVDEPIRLETTITGIVTRELEVVGCYISTLEDLRRVVDLARSGRLDLTASVSCRLPLERVEEAVRLLQRRPPGLVRVVLEP